MSAMSCNDSFVFSSILKFVEIFKEGKNRKESV